MSVWVFAILAKATGAHTPIELARAVQLLNCAALTLLFGFAFTRKDEDEQTVWFWTAALAAVDPLGIILQRKIWAQSVLPIFAWALFLAWRARSSLIGSLCWGVAGALLGQIHMSGFFYAAVFVVWSVYAHIRKTNPQPTRWIAWFVGSVLGSLPMIPWLNYLRTAKPALSHWPAPPPALGGNAWRLWVQDAVGWNLDYSLGTVHFGHLGAWPFIGETPTFLVLGGLFVSAGVGGLLVLFLALKLASERLGLLERLRSDGAVAHNLGLAGYGLLMNVLPFWFYRHYLLIVFPFESMTIPLAAHVAGRRSVWVAAVWVAHLVIACTVLWYLHENHGAPGADYGVGYQFQRQHP